jgi:hypothetical protein
LQEDTKPGYCIFCDRLTKTKRKERLVCAAEECNRAYNTEYVRWQRLERVKGGFTQRGEERISEQARWKDLYKERA